MALGTIEFQLVFDQPDVIQCTYDCEVLSTELDCRYNQGICEMTVFLQERYSDMMVQQKKGKPLEELCNLAQDRQSLKPKHLEDKAKTAKNTAWHASKNISQVTDEKKIKGTPWHRTKNTVKHSPLPEIKTLNINSSTPLQEMHGAHSRLSEVLKQVDGMVETAHRLRLSNQFSDEETRRFTTAFSDMTELLKVWQKFLKNAEARPQSPCGTIEGVIFSSLDNSISSSPLVPCSSQSSLFCLTPLARPHVAKRDLAAISDCEAVPEARTIVSTDDACLASASREPDENMSTLGPCVLLPTSPSSASASDAQLEAFNVKSTEGESQAADVSSPLLSTPIITSPPRSVHLKGPSSGGSSVGTPPHLREHLNCTPGSPPSVDLLTPAIPKELVLRYPRSFGKMGSIISPSTPIPETPGFGSSPPKTCRPLGLTKMGCLADSAEPSTPCVTAKKYFETPYATPGSVLPPMTPMSSSREGLTPLVDDITASAIKRMGVKGLEDELWRKLKAWNIDSCLTGRSYVKSRLSFGGPRSAFANDLESIKEICEHGPTIDPVSEEGFEVRRRGAFI